MANHRHKPTPEQRALVESLAGIGVTHKQICAIMKIGADTLIKYYTDELVLGDAKATAKVAQSLFNKAVGGDVASMIFWMKARAKWSERQVLANPDGARRIILENDPEPDSE